MDVQSAATATLEAPIVTAQDRKKRWAALMVIAFGTFIVWGATYANPITLHNAAHDSRHALGFPCH